LEKNKMLRGNANAPRYEALACLMLFDLARLQRILPFIKGTKLFTEGCRSQTMQTAQQQMTLHGENMHSEGARRDG
jgi:hypothetical protein